MRTSQARTPNTSLDQATVVENCAGRLAQFKIPNDIAIVEALPRMLSPPR